MNPLKWRPVFAPEGEGGSSSAAPAVSSPPSGSQPQTPTAPSSTPAETTPSSTSSGASSTPAATQSESAPFDYGSIFNDPSDSPVVTPVTPAPKPGATPVPPVAAEAPKPGTGAAPAVAPPTTVPQTPGQQDGATPPSVSPQAPQYNPADPGSLALALRENESAAIEHVAQSMFRLSQEDIGAFEADVAGTVPRLLARVMVKSQQQMFTLLSQFVPQMIQRHNEVTKRQTGNEDKFYSAWPGLDREKHGELVRTYGAAYRKANPNMPLDQMVQDLGRMVSALANVPAGALKVPPTGTNGVRPPPSPSFVPAVAGTVGHSSAAEPGAYDFLGQTE